MELVFVYDDKIAQDTEGNYYVGSAFSQEVFDRYLEYFDSITLLMRRAYVAPDDKAELKRWNRIESRRIRVVILPDLWDRLGSFFSIRKQILFRRTVRENITDDRAVIIRMPSTAGTIAARKCKKIGKAYLAEAVGCPWDSLKNHSLKGKVLAPFAWLKMRFSMLNADYAVYVTEKFLQKRYPSNGKTVGVSDVQLEEADETILEARNNRKRSGKLKIGTAGAVHVAYKGQRYVIEALSKLKSERNTKYEYHVAGGGDNSALKNLAEQLGVAEQVVFEGSLPHDAMFDWLDSMDLYIQPSTVEGLPRALVEAMSRGLPAFASRVGGMPELLDEGAVFSKGDVDAIADKLRSFDEETARLMSVRNFERAKDFQKEKLEKKRDRFYSEFAKTAEENYK